MLKPYQLTLCIRTDPTRPVLVIFGNSTSLRALQPFIFGVNFTKKLVFSQNIAHDWPELVLKPYHMTLCIRKDTTEPVSVIFGSSTSLRALQPFIFGANFTKNSFFFLKISHMIDLNQCWNLIYWLSTLEETPPDMYKWFFEIPGLQGPCNLSYLGPILLKNCSFLKILLMIDLNHCWIPIKWLCSLERTPPNLFQLYLEIPPP